VRDGIINAAVQARSRSSVAVKASDPQVKDLLNSLAIPDVSKVLKSKVEPLRVPYYKLLTMEELEKVIHLLLIFSQSSAVVLQDRPFTYCYAGSGFPIVVWSSGSRNFFTDNFEWVLYKKRHYVLFFNVQ